MKPWEFMSQIIKLKGNFYHKQDFDILEGKEFLQITTSEPLFVEAESKGKNQFFAHFLTHVLNRKNKDIKKNVNTYMLSVYIILGQ